MDKKISLFDLPLNQSAVICSIDCKQKLKKRFEDLGLIEGEAITPVINSPFGDPRAYLVQNTIIAIRNRDSRKITVKSETRYEKEKN